MTLPKNEFSDHCKIVTEINGLIGEVCAAQDSYAWNKVGKKYIWNDEFKAKFINFLNNANNQINEINQRNEAGLVESTGLLIQQLFKSAGDFASNRNKKTAKSKQNRTSKFWFDSECKTLKGEARNLGKLKRKSPHNTFLREIYSNKLKEFKRKCTSKRYYFWQSKFETLERSLHDPKVFWENWKNCSETPLNDKQSKINGSQWYNHFSELHKAHNQGNIQASLSDPKWSH